MTSIRRSPSHARRSRWRTLAVVPGVLVGSAALAETASISIPPAGYPELKCLVAKHHAGLQAEVDAAGAGSSVRLYFRRLSPDPKGEFFYFVEMHPAGDGVYWTTFPQPQDQKQEPLDEEWWNRLQDRHRSEGKEGDWLESYFRTELETPGQGFSELQDRLEALENEAAEYYVAVYDAHEKLLARSEILLVEVVTESKARETTDRIKDCLPVLSTLEKGWAANLTVGETSADQREREVFHWLCDGVSARIGADGIPRPDERCQRCIIGHLLPAAPCLAARLACAAATELGGRPELIAPLSPLIPVDS